MNVKFRAVGNSMTVTVPHSIVSKCNLRSGDSAEVTLNGNVIQFTPCKRMRADELLENYFGKAAEEVGLIESGPDGWGCPAGGEIW